MCDAKMIAADELAPGLFENHEVRIFGTINEPLFVARDIGKLLELTDISVSIKEFNNTEKIMSKINTRGGMQQMTLLTYKGMQRLLQCTRKDVPKSCLDYFKMTEVRFTPKETEFVSNIRLAFSDIVFIEQYQVLNYRIDLYAPAYRLAIEFDEGHHKQQANADELREKIISNHIRCTFTRIIAGENIFVSIDRIRRQIHS